MEHRPVGEHEPLDPAVPLDPVGVGLEQDLDAAALHRPLHEAGGVVVELALHQPVHDVQ